MKHILLLGSGPNVVNCRSWPRAPFDAIVTINNAWSVRSDWDYLVHPEDFPHARRPTDIASTQQIITADTYVAAQNSLGGFVYAGGTMAFTAAYWTLATLRPKTIAVLGCDMVYAGQNTHFYGQGTADPLRKDVTLRSLKAKSARLMVMAANQGCAIVNLSADESRLVFPRSTPNDLPGGPLQFDADATAAALAEEDRLGYFVPSGKYWKQEEQFDPAAIDALDALWLKAAQPFGTSLSGQPPGARQYD